MYKDSRLKKDFAPFVIYVPKRCLMFKMMRACIGVKNEKDLWFMPKPKNRRGTIKRNNSILSDLDLRKKFVKRGTFYI